MDLLLKNGLMFLNGQVVTRSVAINMGLIEGIYERGSEPAAKETIDCSQAHILPGIIDAHVHLRDLNQAEKEDFATGTMAAAAGGITTVIDMPNNDPPVLNHKVLREKIAVARENRYVNVGFFMGVPRNTTRLSPSVLHDVLGLKVYPHRPLSKSTKYSPSRIKRCLEIAKSNNLPLLFHPDSSDPADRVESIDDFYRIHGCLSEHNAIEQFLRAQEEVGGRLHVCHVSCAASARLIEAHRAEESLTAEVTPHHLFLSRDRQGHGNGTAKMLPPLRSPYDNKVLLNALQRCAIDIVASDHAPHTEEEKKRPFLEAASGIPGLETLAPIMLTEVFQENISWVEFLRSCCSGPATIFGLRSKGVLAKGYDADIIVVERSDDVIRGSRFYSKAKITPFEGDRVVAKVRTTIVGGTIVYNNGKFQVGRGVAGRVPIRKT